VCRCNDYGRVVEVFRARFGLDADVQPLLIGGWCFGSLRWHQQVTSVCDASIEEMARRRQVGAWWGRSMVSVKKLGGHSGAKGTTYLER
jgi:hypothetical protein